jgi:kumamolisin
MPLAAAWLLISPSLNASASPGRQPIPGTDAPGMAGATRLGDLDPSARLSVAVALPLRNQAALQQFIASVSTPSSSLYGRYLTPQQFTDQYGPTAQQVSTITSYLTAHGLHIDSVAVNREVIDASGTVAAMSGAFGTTLGRYHDSRLGRDFFANDSAANVPGDIAPLIVGVAGLSNHYLLHHSRAIRPHVGGGPAGGYTPAQLKTAYDVNPLATAGYTGGSQHVGLFELDGFQQSNITTYDNQYGLSSPAPVKVNVDGGSGPLGGGQVEVELDIEVIQAIAPAANITVWEGPNSAQGVVDTYNAMVTSNTTPTNSTSWGLCESQANTIPGFISSEDQIFQQGAAQGLSFFAASGDNGAFDCGSGAPPSTLAVDNPADDPYMTGTGGTALNLNGNDTYSSESAWGDHSRNIGSGGGLSTVFTKPSWQTGPGVPSDNSRLVPDIASDADPNTGISIYTTINHQTGWTVVGGTSAAAPSWAAFAALYNQDATANGKPRLGFANPVLYTLAGGSQAFPAFHDITTGDNLFYSATTGWDYPTGLGTYNAYNLARDLIAGGIGAVLTNGGFETGTFAGWTTGGAASSIVTSPHSGTYAAKIGATAPTNGDSTMQQTITVPASGGTLTFWYQTVCPDTLTYDWSLMQIKNGAGTVLATPLSKTCTNNSTWTQVSFSLATWSSQSVVLFFLNHDDNYGADPTYTLFDDIAVGAPPNDFSISANPSTLTLAPSTGGSSTISTAVTSGAAQNVALSVSGTPSGASASLNPTSVTAGSSSTLSVNAGAAAAGTYTLTVTGTGSAAVHSTTVSLTVTFGGAGAVVNGGFETGTFSGWTTSGASESVVTSPHTGTYAARLGSTAVTNGDSKMQQTITVPSGGGTLTFWYKSVCTDTVTYDWGLMQIKNTGGTILATPLNKTCSNTGAWVQVNYSLTSLANQQIVLYFANRDDNYPGDPTYTLFDDISVH